MRSPLCVIYLHMAVSVLDSVSPFGVMAVLNTQLMHFCANTIQMISSNNVLYSVFLNTMYCYNS